MTEQEQTILTRIRDAGWRPYRFQLGQTGKRLESRGLIRFDYGADGSPDALKLVGYITPVGRLKLAAEESKK